MTDKEIREIRRRFRASKNNILSIKGCIVDKEKNIKAYIDQSLINTVSDDCDKLLSLLKKTLSGTAGTNLYDIEYTATEVMSSEAHRLLMTLRDTGLKNDECLSILYSKIIESVQFDGDYAILAASDNYDVFNYNENGEKEEESTSVFSYFVCCVCPIKQSKPSLYYSSFDNTFRMTDNFSLIANPELGFMFPTFDDRATNIYKAQFYAKDLSDNHPDFIKNIFDLDPPKPSAEQKESFNECLKEALTDECNMSVVKSVHEHIAELVEESKAENNDEPLKITKNTFKNVFESCGISENKVNDFEKHFDEQFGEHAKLAPTAVMDIKKFEVATPYVTIKVDPERSDLISTEIINGSKYILIRANDGIEVNGVNIDLS